VSQLCPDIGSAGGLPPYAITTTLSDIPSYCDCLAFHTHRRPLDVFLKADLLVALFQAWVENTNELLKKGVQTVRSFFFVLFYEQKSAGQSGRTRWIDAGDVDADCNDG
jgi:hypothetical protein